MSVEGSIGKKDESASHTPGSQFRIERTRVLFENECDRLRRVYPEWDNHRIMTKAEENMQKGKKAKARVRRNPHILQASGLPREWGLSRRIVLNPAGSSSVDETSSSEEHTAYQTSGDSSAGTSDENQTQNLQ